MAAALGADSESERARRWLDGGGPPAPAIAAALGRAERALRRSGPPALHAQALVRLGRYAEALARLRASEDGLRWKIEAELQLGLTQAANEDAARAARDGCELLCVCALARRAAGDTARAQALLERAARLAPKDAFARALLGLLAYDLGDRPRAWKELGRAAAMRPRAGWPLALRAVLLRLDEDMPACLRALEEAARLEPAPWILRLLARGRQQDCRIEEALAAFGQAIGLGSPDPALYAERGCCLFYRKQYPQAAADFSAAARLAPKRAEYLWQRAGAYWLGGKMELARADAAACLRLEPKNPEYLLGLARLELLGGEASSARRRLHGYLKDPALEAGARFLLAEAELRDEHYDAARRGFSAADLAQRARPGQARYPAEEYGELSRALAFMTQRRTAMPKKPSKTAVPKLILAGLGLRYPQQATLEVLMALKGCDVIFSNLAGGEAMEFLQLFCKDVRTVSYEGADEERWTDKIFTAVKPGRTVAFVTRGHPLVSGHIAHRLLKRARKLSVDVRSFGAISTVDTMLAMSQEVLLEASWGLQAYDAKLLIEGKARPQTGLPMILYLGLPVGADGPAQMRAFCSGLIAALAKEYPPAHKILLHERYDAPHAEAVELSRLGERLLRTSPPMFSAVILLVPPKGGTVPSPL